MSVQVDPQIESPPRTAHQDGGLPHRRLKVLVVDDEKAFCFAIAEILSLNGHDVVQANGVSQALAQMIGEVPDLILTDIMMPGTDGLSFIRSLRSRPLWAKIPIIAVSAKASAEDLAAATSAGADGYLTKPFSAEELQAAIRPYVQRAAVAA
jgi:CheY-like chemotaxis protein